jgi:hypothetical protein
VDGTRRTFFGSLSYVQCLIKCCLQRHLAEDGGSSQEGRRRLTAWQRSDTHQHRGFGGFILKTISAVWWFGPQNHR